MLDMWQKVQFSKGFRTDGAYISKIYNFIKNNLKIPPSVALLMRDK